jgi:glycosyltransferase involved in cell wall biosynthesis
LYNANELQTTRSRTGIIALTSDLWTSPWSTRHLVLTRLVKKFPIVWVEPSLAWRKQWLTPSGWSPRNIKGTGDMQVLKRSRFSPLVYRPRSAARSIRRARLEQARQMLLARGVERIALYLWRPELGDALDLVKHDFSVYHIDDEYTFSKVDLANMPAEVDLIRRVDEVIVHSTRLMEKKGGINPRTRRIPNGVDYTSFSTPRAEPADIANIPHPRVGYSGVIKTQMDLDLMYELAVRRPQFSFVYVGPVGFLGPKLATWNKIAALPNVYVRGLRTVDELPAYAQHFDVCVMCYEVTDYTNQIFPLKLNEYLATGRPIVTSGIDAVLPFHDVVQIASGTESWLKAIDWGLSAEAMDPAKVAERQAVARQSDWGPLVERVAEVFDPQQPVDRPDSAAWQARTA